ncbi:hypothetical protein [Streptomyces sp. V1I1]|uniref:hypothetical protein n=1 Tax=Streptomyces sp. V1I1 TaxID=3042272 RepID=UPI0027807DD4|nr:outer membrane biosynthesis protein TonB [Streptomyces sp. V1I1]
MRSGLVTFRAAGVAAVLVLAPTAAAAYAADSVKVTVVPSKVAPGGEVEVLVSGCQGMTGAARSQGFVAYAALASRNGAGTQLFGETTVKSSVEPGTYNIGVTCDGREHPVSARVQVVQNEPTERPDEPTKRPNEPTKRPDHSTERPDEPTKRADEPAKRRDEPTKRAEESTKRRDESTKQSEESSKRPDESSKRGDHPTEQSYEPTEESDEGESDEEESDESTDDSTPFAPVRAGGGGTAALAADGPPDPAEAGPGIPHTVIGLVLAGAAAVAVAFRSSRRRRSDSD